MGLCRTRRVALAAGTAIGFTLALTGTASAHSGMVHAAGFGAGLAHPLSGLDHVLAMVAIGLWAAQQGGRAVIALPASFAAAMVLGAVLGHVGVAVPFAESGIVLSVLVLGLMVAAPRVPLVVAIAIAGFFAVFHGHAHGVEMPADLSSAGFVAGFVAATLGLHAIGIALALARRPRASLVRERDFA